MGGVSFENRKSFNQIIEEYITDYFLVITKEDFKPPKNLYKILHYEFEQGLLKGCLKYTKGNKKKTADLLGISRTTLRKKIQE